MGIESRLGPNCEDGQTTYHVIYSPPLNSYEASLIGPASGDPVCSPRRIPPLDSEHLFAYTPNMEAWELEHIRRSIAMLPEGHSAGALTKERAMALVHEALAAREDATGTSRPSTNCGPPC
jgi:hypothetical protein